jgi:hypothetical protein
MDKKRSIGAALAGLLASTALWLGLWICGAQAAPVPVCGQTPFDFRYIWSAYVAASLIDTMHWIALAVIMQRVGWPAMKANMCAATLHVLWTATLLTMFAVGLDSVRPYMEQTRGKDEPECPSCCYHLKQSTCSHWNATDAVILACRTCFRGCPVPLTSGLDGASLAYIIVMAYMSVLVSLPWFIIACARTRTMHVWGRRMRRCGRAFHSCVREWLPTFQPPPPPQHPDVIEMTIPLLNTNREQGA